MLAKAGMRSTFHLMISVGIGKPEGGVKLPTDLVLDIDGSGSMGGSMPGTADSKMDKVKEAAQTALDRLGPEDRIAIVLFTTYAITLLPLTKCDGPGKTLAGNVIWNKLGSGGGTAFSTGMKAALEVLGESTPGRNRTVLKLTDGNNEGEAGYPFGLCTEMKDKGVTLYIAGLGVDNALETHLQEMAKTNSVETNFRGLKSSADVVEFFKDVQAAASGTVIKNAQLRVTPVTYANIGNFELVTRSKQASYVAAEDASRTMVNVGDIGSEESLDFYLNMGLVLPEDIKEGRRSFGKIELVGDVVSTGEKGSLRAGNIVVPFVTQLDPGAQPDPEVREMMGIAATQRELAVYEKTGNTEALTKAADAARKTQAFSRADAAKLLQSQIVGIQAKAASNPAEAQQDARKTKAFSAADRAKLLGNKK